MRREILIFAVSLVTLSGILLFMTQNTRFESTVIACKRPSETFKISFESLSKSPNIIFESGENLAANLPVVNTTRTSFKFQNQVSSFQIDLVKEIATKTTKGEVIIYHCSKTQFKM